jgi:translocation and assembly module TamB
MKRRTRNFLIALPLALVLGVVGISAWLLNTGSGSRWLLERATAGLGEALSIASVEGDFSNGMVLKGIEYDAGSHRVSVTRAQVSLNFRLAGPVVEIRSLQMDDVVIRENPGSATDNDSPLQIPDLLAELVLPVRVEIADTRVTGLVYQDEKGETLLAVDQIHLAANWHQQVEDLQLEIQMDGLTARADGRIDLAESARHELRITGQINGAAIFESLPDDLEYEISLAGDGKTADLRVSSVAAGLNAQGPVTGLWERPAAELMVDLVEYRLPWPEGDGALLRNVEGRVVLSADAYQADLRAGLDWPALEPLAVALRGQGDWQSIDIEKLDVRGDFITADASGRVQWGDNPGIKFTSKTGQATISGLPDSWQVDSSLDFDTPDYPGGGFELTGAGGLESGRFDIARGEALGGTVLGNLDAHWGETVAVAAELEVEQLDLSVLLPEWPARLDAQGHLDYRAGENGLFAIELDRLAGKYKGEALSGQGGLRFDSAGWHLDAFSLQSGASSVTADGSTSTINGLSLQLDIARPGWLANQVGGNVSGHVRYAPAAGSPLPEIDLVGSDLRISGISVEQFSITGQTEAAHGEFAVDASVRGLRAPGTRLDSIKLKLAGNKAVQDLELDIASEEYRVQGRLEGSVADWENVVASGWSGRLNDLQASLRGNPLARLTEAADLSLSGSGVRVGHACLELASDGQLCIGELAAGDDGLQTAVTLVAIPVAAVHLFFDSDIEFTHMLDGELNWRQRWGEKPSGNAEIRVSPGRFGEGGDEDEMIQTGEGLIGFQMTNGNLTAGHFDIPFPGTGEIDIDLSIDGLDMGGNGRIDGSALVRFDDLSSLDGLTAYLDGIQGRLNSRLLISGRVGDPLLDGSFSLSAAQFDMPALGTGIRNLQLRGEIGEDDRAQVVGRFTAGEGAGRMQLDLDLSDLANPHIMMRLAGEGLLAADLPDLRVEIDPDARLERIDGEWRVGGQIHIPRATVSPLTSFVSKITESEDLVVVAGTRTPKLEAAATDRLVLGGELTVTLGDNVHLEADLASLDFNGSLDLAWNGPLMPFADGAINLNGNVTAWGPILRISNGRVRWPGVPANNPVLDIRAERDVFGNTMIRTAGIRISGTARRPDIEAFTNPLTTRQRAWAVLITGSDVNFGRGIGALDIGTYIAPRIFLSYGISLFDNDNVVGLRYDLKKGWGVKATSGQRETGVDVSYTIEQ